jgi:DNA-directed RNA polymerase subunit alpha
MLHQQDKFVSYIESQMQENGELYARFHLGTFVQGQALTIANALRRTLLSEVPGFAITHVEIDGASHEFSTLPGVHESVLNILLNIKRMAITSRTNQALLRFSDSTQNTSVSPHFNAYVNLSGPGTVTAANIHFPPDIAPVFPDHHIALLSGVSTLKLDLSIAFVDPLHLSADSQEFGAAKHSNVATKKPNNMFFLDNTPKPVRQVNYGIHDSTVQNSGEYISLEIWTDGSIHPKQALECALERLTRLFFEFTLLEKRTAHSIM